MPFGKAIWLYGWNFIQMKDRNRSLDMCQINALFVCLFVRGFRRTASDLLKLWNTEYVKNLMCSFSEYTVAVIKTKMSRMWRI